MIFAMLLCLNSFGQHKRGPLSQDNIPNSRRELRRDKNIHDASTHAATDNEHFARKKHKLGVRLYHKPHKRKMPKENTVVVNNKK